MLKKSFLLLLLTICFAGLNAQTVKITEPVKYNDYIVEQQNRIGGELLKLIGMFDALPEDKSETVAQLDVVISTCTDAISKLKNLKTINNEFGMKQAALELFEFYEEIMDTDYRKVIDELYHEVPDMTVLQDILVKVQESEAVVDQKFQTAQGSFAKYHNMQLEENELQEEFDEAGEE